MPKGDFGTKLECPECGTKFYDLHKNPATCPSCAHEFDPIAWLEEKFGQTHPDAPESDIEDMQATVSDDEDLEEDDDEVVEIDVEAEKVPAPNASDEDEDLESAEVPMMSDEEVDVEDDVIDIDSEADDDVTVLDDGSEFSESELGVFEKNKDDLDE